MTSPQRNRAERGATAVLVALLLIPLLGFAALAVDISSRTQTRQDLWDTLDASALAGAAALPDGTAAGNAALEFAQSNMDGLVPALGFFCVVGANGLGLPDSSQIPVTCDPGPGPYDAGTYPGLSCNADICAIPCDPFPPDNDTCNTLTVEADRDVPYRFAPVIGYDTGNTGVLRTAACRGSCGNPTASPGDLVLVLDRTGSMRPQDVAALQDASRAFLENLTPSLHHVALGTLGRTASAPPPGCPTTPSSSGGAGPWVPVGLRNDYDLTDNDPPDSPPDLNSGSQLVQGIACLTNSSTGTNLGDPLAAAGAHLLANGRTDVPRGILFMTDGEANQPAVGSPCNHAKTQAAAVEATDTTIITVAYRLQGVNCGGELATTVLAEMATDPVSGGVVTADDGGDGPNGLAPGCTTHASITAENADGDHFLCAPSEAELTAVFIAAADALIADQNDKLRLIRIPG